MIFPRKKPIASFSFRGLFFYFACPVLAFCGPDCLQSFEECATLLGSPIPASAAGILALKNHLLESKKSVAPCSLSCATVLEKQLAIMQCRYLEAKIGQCEMKIDKIRTPFQNAKGKKPEAEGHGPETKTGGFRETASNSGPLSIDEIFRKTLFIVTKDRELFSSLRVILAPIVMDPKTVAQAIKSTTNADTLKLYIQAVSSALEKSVKSGQLAESQIDSTLAALIRIIVNSGFFLVDDSMTVALARLAFTRAKKNPSLYPALFKALHENEGSLLLTIILNQDKIDRALRREGRNAHDKMKTIVDSLSRQYGPKRGVSEEDLDLIAEKAVKLLEQSKSTGVVAVLPFPREGAAALQADSKVLAAIRERLKKRLVESYSVVDVGDYSDIGELRQSIQKTIGDSIGRSFSDKLKGNTAASSNKQFVVLCPFVVDDSSKLLRLYLRVADLKDGGIIASVDRPVLLTANDRDAASAVDSMIMDLKSELVNSALWRRYRSMALDSSDGIDFADGSAGRISLFSNKTLRIVANDPRKLELIRNVKGMAVSTVFGPNDSRTNRYSNFKNILIKTLQRRFNKTVLDGIAQNDSTLDVIASVADTQREILSLNFMLVGDTLLTLQLPTADDSREPDVTTYFTVDLICGVLSNYLDAVPDLPSAPTAEIALPLQQTRSLISPWCAIPAFFPAGASHIINGASLSARGTITTPRIFYGALLAAAQLTFMGLAIGSDQRAISAEKNGDRIKANGALDRKYGFFWATVGIGVVGSLSFLADWSNDCSWLKWFNAMID